MLCLLASTVQEATYGIGTSVTPPLLPPVKGDARCHNRTQHLSDWVAAMRSDSQFRVAERRRLKLQALEEHARQQLEREACIRQEIYGRDESLGAS